MAALPNQKINSSLQIKKNVFLRFEYFKNYNLKNKQYEQISFN